MRSKSLGGIVALLLVTVGLSAFGTAPSTAKDYHYGKTLKCGTLSNVRMASVLANGHFNADLGLSGYKISWDDHVSRLSFLACGSAAPYGPYRVNAKKQVLTTRFTVSSATLKSCKPSATFGVSIDKSGSKTGVDASVACSIGKKTQTQVLRTTGAAYDSVMKHGTSLDVSGTYCNAASLGLTGVVYAPKYAFNPGVVKFSKKVYVC
jgi:hypothetical protein